MAPEADLGKGGRVERRFGSEGPGARGPFERDRDRILHSSALRRLAAVTQVVDPSEGHIFHNRLTHTLKVAQIGRRLAQRLLKEQPDEASAIGSIDPEVVEAAALAHDLGHPPFGHIAERKLDELLTSDPVRLRDGYEGNAQSFRIVTKLAIRSDSHRGLDLTQATLCSILKYPWFRQNDGKRARKWGAYQHTEAQDFHFARAPQTGYRRSAEAELMDWADDITYAIHDLEDFYRAGLVPIDRLTVYPDERKRWVNEVFERRDQEEVGLPQDRFEEVADRVISSLVTARPYKGSRADRAALRHTTSSLINFYAGAISLRVPASDDEPFVVIRPGAVDDVKILKELTWHFVISNPALATQQHGKERVIAELFSIFMDASTSKRWRNILPVRCREELGSSVSDQDRARVIADVVSSLSDQEAVSIHERLTGVRAGSLLDFLLP